MNRAFRKLRSTKRAPLSALSRRHPSFYWTSVRYLKVKNVDVEEWSGVEPLTTKYKTPPSSNA